MFHPRINKSRFLLTIGRQSSSASSDSIVSSTTLLRWPPRLVRLRVLHFIKRVEEEFSYQLFATTRGAFVAVAKRRRYTILSPFLGGGCGGPGARYCTVINNGSISADIQRERGNRLRRNLTKMERLKL